MNAYLSGDEAAEETALRDVINATIGFEQLAAELQEPSKTNTTNFFAILRLLQKKTASS